MKTRKSLFSVSDREKLDNCLCMRCTNPVCLALDGKACNMITVAKKQPDKEKTEVRK